MTRTTHIGTALVVLAIVLFTAPAIFPVQPILVHDTNPGTFDGPDQLESQGFEIVGYENLSARGQELYVSALENGGEYTVPVGEGADDFPYLTDYERSDAQQEDPDRQPDYLVVERSVDGDLPRANEPYHDVSEDDDVDEDRYRQVQRYDVVLFSKGPPPLDSTPQLLRFGAGLLAVVSFGIGGYLLSSTRRPS